MAIGPGVLALARAAALLFEVFGPVFFFSSFSDPTLDRIDHAINQSARNARASALASARTPGPLAIKFKCKPHTHHVPRCAPRIPWWRRARARTRAAPARTAGAWPPAAGTTPCNAHARVAPVIPPPHPPHVGQWRRARLHWPRGTPRILHLSVCNDNITKADPPASVPPWSLGKRHTSTAARSRVSATSGSCI